MQAIVITKPGGPEVLELKEVETPEPGQGEVRVRVKAAGLNRLDLLQRRGNYPAPPGFPQDILGVEYSGTIDKVGPGVTDFQPGQRVFGLTGGGAYAQYLVIHAGTVMRIPDNLSFTEAAAVPEAFVTAYDAMISQAGLHEGETVLISAAGSGVGSAALQIARAFGAKSIGTARKAEKLNEAKKFGLDIGIVPAGMKFAEEVMASTGEQGVDVIIELVGGGYLQEDLNCLANRGRIVVVGLVGGRTAEIDLGLAMRKRATIMNTTMRVRPLEEKIQVAEAVNRDIIPRLASGALKPVVDRVLPLADAADAHRCMENNENFGKLVLEVEQ